MRQREFKKRYDPDLDMHVRKHIYGEGITDVFKAVGSKLFGKTAKSMAKKAATKATTTAATKTGEYAGKKAGDKIVELLSKKKTPRESSILSGPDTSKQVEKSVSTLPSKELTPYEVKQKINQMLSGGKLRRVRNRNFI